MASLKALECDNIMSLVNDSELDKFNDVKRTFEYKLNDKAAKAKLVKGAKRVPFDIFENSTSSNLNFSLGTWYNVVLPTVRYWDQVKGIKSCKIDNFEIQIDSVKFGNEAGGKHVDTPVVLYANEEKNCMSSL